MFPQKVFPDTAEVDRQGQLVIGGCNVLELAQDSDLAASYTDVADATDVSQGTALVDPLGVVFDSRTGLPVDGATVTLIDNTTGTPATVLGDDGVSLFPATVESGGTATDSGGTVYSFPPGGFRFPLVAPGRARQHRCAQQPRPGRSG